MNKETRTQFVISSPPTRMAKAPRIIIPVVIQLQMQFQWSKCTMGKTNWRLSQLLRPRISYWKLLRKSLSKWPWILLHFLRDKWLSKPFKPCNSMSKNQFSTRTSCKEITISWRITNKITKYPFRIRKASWKFPSKMTAILTLQLWPCYPLINILMIQLQLKPQRLGHCPLEFKAGSHNSRRCPTLV